MSAAAALANLTAAGVRIAADGEGLCYDGPPGAVTPELLAGLRAEKAGLMLVATGSWRVELDGWPEDLRDEWAERAAIREFDGLQPRDLAERAAYLEVREAALAPVADLLAGAAAALGQVVVGLRATPRPQADASPVVRCPDCGARAPSLWGLSRCACCSLPRGARGRGRCLACDALRPRTATGSMTHG